MAIDDAKAAEILRFVESGASEAAYWHSCTPEERLYAMGLMRQRAWGYDENSVPKLDRSFFEIVDVSQYRSKDKQGQESNKPPIAR